MVTPLGAGIRWEDLRPSLVLMGMSVTAYIGILSVFGDARFAVLSLPAIAVALALTSSVEFAFAAVILALFVEFPISWYSPAVWATLPLGLALVLHRKRPLMVAVPPSLTKALLFYGVCIVPSLLFSQAPMASAVKLLNVGAFLIVLYGVASYVRNGIELKRLAFLFLALTIANSLHVIAEAVLFGWRSFGFAGIMFVDFSALGLCVASAMALMSKGAARMALAAVAFTIGTALILTQTRNTWVSAFLTLVFFGVYVIVFPARVRLTRAMALRSLLAGAFLLVVAVLGAFVLNPGAERRAAQLTGPGGQEISVTSSGRVSSSLASRLMIWSTAANAFVERPLTGIGVYAFPFVSQRYSSLPQSLYRRFVQHLTPHQTHVAVLVETGIIGFVGFLVFVVQALRMALKAAARSQGTLEGRAAVVGLTGTVYAFISMFFTDAWLWGPLIVLMGLILGGVAVTDKLLRRSGEAAEA